jgi:hypothetical protein
MSICILHRAGNYSRAFYKSSYFLSSPSITPVLSFTVLGPTWRIITTKNKQNLQVLFFVATHSGI